MGATTQLDFSQGGLLKRARKTRRRFYGLGMAHLLKQITNATPQISVIEQRSEDDPNAEWRRKHPPMNLEVPEQ